MSHANKNAIKKAVQERWLTEGGASAADLELANNYKYTRHLLELSNDTRTLDTTYTVSLNIRTDPLCRVPMYTQVMDVRKYDGSGNMHLLTTLIKRSEQEALSLFRTGVAPRFVTNISACTNTNRFLRTCIFCNYMHDQLHIDDAFHALFICPLVSPERAVMWQVLDSLGGADAWDKFDSVTDLGISLLCPNVPSVASTCMCSR